MSLWSDYKDNYNSWFFDKKQAGMFRDYTHDVASLWDEPSFKKCFNVCYRSVGVGCNALVRTIPASLGAGLSLGYSAANSTIENYPRFSFLTLGALPIATGVISGSVGVASGLVTGVGYSCTSFATAALTAVPAVLNLPFRIASGLGLNSTSNVEQKSSYQSGVKKSPSQEKEIKNGANSSGLKPNYVSKLQPNNRNIGRGCE